MCSGAHLEIVCADFSVQLTKLEAQVKVQSVLQTYPLIPLPGSPLMDTANLVLQGSPRTPPKFVDTKHLKRQMVSMAKRWLQIRQLPPLPQVERDGGGGA
jgi:hypothetical protein